MTFKRVAVVNLVGLLFIALGVFAAENPSVRPADFWARVAVAGVQAERFSSLEEMTMSADAVIVGRLRSISRGRVFGKADPELEHPNEAKTYYAKIKIDVDEIIRGSLDAGWSLEVLVPDWKRVGNPGRYLSDQRGVYFLRSLEREARRLGRSSTEASKDGGLYRLITAEAVINDDQGSAIPPLPGERAFENVEGRGFAQTVAEIRRIGRQP